MEGLLFVVLSKELNCYHIDKLEKKITLNKNIFVECDDNDFSGFYDWLRDSTGKVIGVRYTTLDSFKQVLIKSLKRLPYVNFVHEKIVEIYFHDKNRSIDDENSNDQDFGICKVYSLSNSTFAILFDIEYLTKYEFLSIPAGASVLR